MNTAPNQPQQPQQYAPQQPPMTAAPLNNTRQVVYNRQQTPHSITKHVIIAVCTLGLSLPVSIYFHVSPNHYWKA